MYIIYICMYINYSRCDAVNMNASVNGLHFDIQNRRGGQV